MKVAYIGGSWSSNIGNAFYNLGTDVLLKQIEGIEVFFIPDPPQWREEVKNDFDLISNLDVDLVILTGPCLNLRLIKYFDSIFKNLKARGVKIGFLSAGMSLYDQGEANELKKFFAKYIPDFIFTRDAETYEFYKDLPDTIMNNSVCNSMFLNDAVKVPGLSLSPYCVMNFDSHNEPFIQKVGDCYTIEKATKKQLIKEIGGLDVIRVNNNSIGDGYKSIYAKVNTYHSDLPTGYLTILKNAKVVFSERVHTCASTLILGGTAQYIPVAKRSFEGRLKIFDRVKASTLFEKPTKLNMDYVEGEKAKTVADLQAVFEKIG